MLDLRSIKGIFSLLAIHFQLLNLSVLFKFNEGGSIAERKSFASLLLNIVELSKSWFSLTIKFLSFLITFDANLAALTNIGSVTGIA